MKENIIICIGDCIGLLICGTPVLVCAPSGWGKTSLLLNYFSGKFDEDVKIIQPEGQPFIVTSNGVYSFNMYRFEKIIFVGENLNIICTDNVCIDALYMDLDMTELLRVLYRELCT